MGTRPLRIGTRGSALALRQAEWVAAELRRLHPDVRPELVVIKTRGDRILDAPLSKVGGKGLFVKEIESALLSAEIDLAVHSLKDVPAERTPGLLIAAFSERVDPRDVLISRHGRGLRDLRQGTIIGTSSLRRTAQLKHFRPDLRTVPLRGNVDTRLRKLHVGEVDAIVLAGAGLIRLGREDAVTEWLELDVCVPAAGQGILGIETRENDPDTRGLVAPLDSPVSRACAQAERRVTAALGGSCQVPIGALAEVHENELRLVAVVSDLEGQRLLRASAEGCAAQPEAVAHTVIAELRDLGAEELLAEMLEPDAKGGHPT
jgi:hydroxymethylbilane synthase